MKEALLSPPISSTYSAVSLNGADSNPILPPGVLPGEGKGTKRGERNIMRIRIKTMTMTEK